MSHKQSLSSLMRRTKKTKNGCLEFQGAISTNGYGMVGYMNRVINAHRAVWNLKFGEITNPKILVCHTCDNRKCINPDHLFLGTARDNAQDMVRKGRNGNGYKKSKNITN